MTSLSVSLLFINVLAAEYILYQFKGPQGLEENNLPLCLICMGFVH
jgi:hypothetical protein